MLSMTSDYNVSTGCPREYLQRIAEAGFTHVHWCHQWNTDFLYSDGETAHIAAWLAEYDLGLTDLHGTAGIEKNWGSLLEYEREAGVELIENRLTMTARLGSDVTIMHLPREVDKEETAEKSWEQVWRSLDELRPIARDRGVRIALENGDFTKLEKVFSKYGPEYIGLCYDSGHGNMTPDGLDRLDQNKDRLISLHLHDNNGEKDEHKLLFSGTVDWNRLAGIIAASLYDKWVSMETSIRNTGIEDEQELLRRAFETGTRFTGMIEKAQ